MTIGVICVLAFANINFQTQSESPLLPLHEDLSAFV